VKPVITDCRRLVVYESIGSTQTHLTNLVREGERHIGAVVALEQTEGRGRYGRYWFTPRGGALAVSWACFDYEGWSRPELLGMAAALAGALALDTYLAWPNDLVLPAPQGGDPSWRKVGGVLCELVPSPSGSLVPVIGMGINLSVETFPEELQSVATSLFLAGRPVPTWQEALQGIWEKWEELPEPHTWLDLAPYWLPRDKTVGKRYRLPGGQVGVAQGITEEGWLIAEINGEKVSVPSAEAWLGL
jgi:BirA family biotin operon repressor/biotin-[acetyl-CoA-carboxylase] ligase